MTRRARITTVEEADVAMAKLGWLRTHGQPNGAIRELFECASVFRAAVHLQAHGAEKKPGFVELVEKKRK